MLNAAQMSTLAAAIRANSDPTVVALLAVRNDTGLAEWYNGDGTFVVWRTSVSPEEYRKSGFVWTEVDSLTVGKARIVEWLTGNLALSFNPSDLAVRQGIADAFGAGTTTRANLLALSKRFAKKVEALFTTGTGTDATPGALVVEGSIGVTELSQSLNRF